ncbi:cyclin-dependent kinase 2-associated protein 2 [Aphelenchoides avenae]|nr:cyclin-dependent kinase 2-associated protein 2 [Aphelenchus avenae]
MNPNTPNLQPTPAAQPTQNASLPQYSVPGPSVQGSSKYSQLLALIEELGKDVRPTYTGNRNCTERLKRGIMHARVLVRECTLEIDKSQRQASSSS